MGNLYYYIGEFIMIIFMIASVLILMVNLFILGKAYIYEVDFEWWPSLPEIFTGCPMPIFCIFLMICGFFAGFLWLPAILCGIGYLGLYSLRGFVRFRKKVSKALENKTTENHTHEWGE